MNVLSQDVKLVLKGIHEIHKKSKYFLILSCLFAIFQAVHPFVSIYFSARIIDGIIAKESFDVLMQLVVWLVGTECVCTICFKWMEGITFAEGKKLDVAFSMEVIAKLHRVEYMLVENPDFQSKKEQIENMNQSMGLGVAGIAFIIPFLLQHGFAIFVSIALTLKLFFSFEQGYTGWKGIVCSPIFSAVLIVLIILSVYLNMHFTATARSKEYKHASKFGKIIAKLNFYCYKYILNYRYGKDIRIYNQNDLLMNEITKEKENVYGWYRLLKENRLKFKKLSSLVSVLISGSVYLFVGLKAFVGLITVGSIVQYVGSINQFVNGLTGIMEQLTDLKANNEAVKYYFDYMNIPEVNMGEGISLKEEPREMEFHNVSFKYPGTEIYALRNLSVKFKMNSKTAIVGMNGSGKTTLIKLICRLYRPTEGMITLNGVDIQEYKLDEYYKQLAVVFQDFKIFGFTLGENVSTSVEVDEKRVENALLKSGFEERYTHLKNGIDTYLTKDYEVDGVDLSGGEAQKIAIARALYKNAPIVILDEPTAALDPISEFEIYSRFNEMVGKKMAIFISHRLSSCKFCDDIIVMDSGKMVQHGKHSTLVEDLDGKYFELWNAQAQYYTEGA